jgi:hypothetical protein
LGSSTTFLMTNLALGAGLLKVSEPMNEPYEK